MPLISIMVNAVAAVVGVYPRCAVRLVVYVSLVILSLHI